MRLPAGGAPCECPALALVMPAPGSFTGEDCVELVVPGNPSLVDAVVAALMRTAGVSAAAPGAFMARAHAAGRVALADAERIALEIGAMHARDLEAARHIHSNPLVEAVKAYSRVLQLKPDSATAKRWPRRNIKTLSIALKRFSVLVLAFSAACTVRDRPPRSRSLGRPVKWAPTSAI